MGAFAFASVAQAEPPRLVSDGSFSAQVGGKGAVGVAVGGSGDLFVSGLIGESFAPSTVVKLDPSGNLLSPPSPFGSASYYSGVAVNPTNGDLYVVNAIAQSIEVYDSNTGALLSSFEVPASRNFIGALTDVQIATDSAGNVYVPVVPENKVLEYDPSECPALPEPCALTPLKTFTGGSGAGALKEPTAVAIDSSGDLWVADSGNNRIVELDSSGAPVEVNGKPVEIESEGVFSVALDGHGDVFAVVENNADPCGAIGSSCPHLVEYSSEGRQLADLGAGAFSTHQAQSGDHFFSMVAVNQTSGRVYVTDGNNEKIWVFAPPVAPVVGRELTAEVGVSEAKLGALVNPGGIQTNYRFEYGTEEGVYDHTTPLPEGSVGEGLESHAVWAAASGLAAGSTYHYRVVASSELGTAYGRDQTFTTLSAEQAACPNEQARGGFSGRLPDCRAYELVTPPVTNASQFDASVQFEASTAAADGEALTLHTNEPRPGAPTAGEYYVATRGAGGWIAEDIMPLESYDGVSCAFGQWVYAYSEEFTKDVMIVGAGSSPSEGENVDYQSNPESCNPEGRQVVSGEPVGYENLLVRSNATGTYRLVNVTPPGVTPADAHFQAASADLSHVIFTETSPLAQGAQYGLDNMYEWDEGAVRLVSVLPDGTAVPGSLPAPVELIGGHAAPRLPEGVLSSDGSHVLFTYGGALYDRIDGERTVQVDKTQGPGASGGGIFKTVTADGSKVFFLDESKLTPDSTAAAGEPDLYECALGEGASKCELVDLTVAAGGEHADVLHVTPLGPHDSSYVYFLAKGVLASGATPAPAETCQPEVKGQHPEDLEGCNLYVSREGKTTFITTGVAHGGRLGLEQASPDGKWLSFESKQSLTGYDNASHEELFLYSAVTGQLACASCNPTGEPPVAGGGVVPFGAIPGEEDARVFQSRRVLTDAGQVFFQTVDALVPSDTDGQQDVYEYEGGHLYPISSGTSSAASTLEDVSESGNDVFFRSTQALVPQDNQEGQFVIYDARLDGGFPEASSPPACTTADACRTPVPPQPSIYGAPSSQTFSGAGNLTPSEVKPQTKPKAKLVRCKKGFTKSKTGKCVRKKSKQAKKAKRARKTNRKGSK